MSDTIEGRDKTAGPQDGLALDELRGLTPDELVQWVTVADAKLRSMHQDDETGELREKTEVDQKAFDHLLVQRDKAMKKIDEHRAIMEKLKERPRSVQVAIGRLRDELEGPGGDIRRMSTADARSQALRTLDSRRAAAHLRTDQKEQVERAIERNPDIAKRIIVTENDDYRTAFMKLSTDPHAILTDEERNAVLRFNEYRAMSEGTTTAGGFGIPVFIDPSIILTAQGTGNPFLTLAKQVDVNTNMWKGVSSAGVSWAFQSEGVAVTDNSPTLAQPTVQVYMARGFIPYSIEVGQDYPGFADEMGALLASGYNELLIDKFTRGSGVGEPNGLVTQLSANTNVRVRVQTSGAFGSAEPYNLWAALPQRYKLNANWLMSVGVNNAIRQLGTANVYHAFTENLPGAWADVLFGKGVYEDPYMNTVTSSTSATTELAVVGDFSNYVIARRGGMSVELVPQLFDVTNNRPTGQRGWFAYARIGGNSVNDLGFRLLVNT